MGTRVFLENKEYKLVGDERDVMVPHHLLTEVSIWCWDNGINAVLNYQGSDVRWMVQKAFKVDLWRVEDDKQRAMFILRWS